MNNYKMLSVRLGDKKVGTLAKAAGHLIAFEYDADWIRTGFSISPFSLPLQSGVFLPKGYNLTYSNSIGGEHATTIDGNGRNPGMQEILAVYQDRTPQGDPAGQGSAAGQIMDSSVKHFDSGILWKRLILF